MDNTFSPAIAITSRLACGRQSGFNLVEVMVALLVLAAGLLGMAALQKFSLASTHQSYQRTQATIAIQDMADKMRANKGASGDPLVAHYNIPAYTNTPPAMLSDCAAAAAACTPAVLATYDMNTWMTHLTSNQMLGPTAQAQILVQGNITTGAGAIVGRQYQIGVRWMEGDLLMTQTMTLEAP